MTSSRFHGRGTMPRPRERVYTLDKQKKHLARLSLLSAKRFRFNDKAEARYPVASRAWFGLSLRCQVLQAELTEHLVLV